MVLTLTSSSCSKPPPRSKQNGTLSSSFKPEGEKTLDLVAMGVLERVVVGVCVNIYFLNPGR
jgi:hypothetical protein